MDVSVCLQGKTMETCDSLLFSSHFFLLFPLLFPGESQTLMQETKKDETFESNFDLLLSLTQNVKHVFLY